MAFGGFDNKGSGNHAMSEINMVPLIDVMLVLLVIFIITAPLLAHSIKINMPQVSAEPIEQEPKVIDLALDAQGNMFWDEKPVTMDQLPARLATQAPQTPQPEIRIRADRDTRYDILAQVMGAARQAGMKRIGFVTTPAPQTGAGSPGSATAPAMGASSGIAPAPVTAASGAPSAPPPAAGAPAVTPAPGAR